MEKDSFKKLENELHEYAFDPIEDEINVFIKDIAAWKMATPADQVALMDYMKEMHHRLECEGVMQKGIFLTGEVAYLTDTGGSFLEQVDTERYILTGFGIVYSSDGTPSVGLGLASGNADNAPANMYYAVAKNIQNIYLEEPSSSLIVRRLEESNESVRGLRERLYNCQSKAEQIKVLGDTRIVLEGEAELTEMETTMPALAAILHLDLQNDDTPYLMTIDAQNTDEPIQAMGRIEGINLRPVHTEADTTTGYAQHFTPELIVKVPAPHDSSDELVMQLSPENILAVESMRPSLKAVETLGEIAVGGVYFKSGAMYDKETIVRHTVADQIAHGEMAEINYIKEVRQAIETAILNDMHSEAPFLLEGTDDCDIAYETREYKEKAEDMYRAVRLAFGQITYLADREYDSKEEALYSLEDIRDLAVVIVGAAQHLPDIQQVHIAGGRQTDSLPEYPMNSIAKQEEAGDLQDATPSIDSVTGILKNVTTEIIEDKDTGTWRNQINFEVAPFGDSLIITDDTTRITSMRTVIADMKTNTIELWRDVRARRAKEAMDAYNEATHLAPDMQEAVKALVVRLSKYDPLELSVGGSSAEDIATEFSEFEASQLSGVAKEAREDIESICSTLLKGRILMQQASADVKDITKAFIVVEDVFADEHGELKVYGRSVMRDQNGRTLSDVYTIPLAELHKWKVTPFLQ